MANDIINTDIWTTSDSADVAVICDDSYIYIPPPIKITGNIIGTGTIILTSSQSGSQSSNEILTGTPNSISGGLPSNTKFDKVKGTGSFKRI